MMASSSLVPVSDQHYNLLYHRTDSFVDLVQCRVTHEGRGRYDLVPTIQVDVVRPS